MGLPAISACLIAAILPLIWLPSLPDLPVIWVGLGLGFFLAWLHPVWLRFVGLWMIFFGWGVLAAQGSVWQMQHLTVGRQQVEVVITATDGATQHQARIVRHKGARWFSTTGVSLYGQYLPQAVCVGQRWAMTLNLRAVHGQLNEGGFDTQRYALALHQPLSGRFTQADVLDAKCSLRARYLASLTSTLAPWSWGSVILGLGMGERLAVAQETKTLMRETGTLHLMAISGLHIALAASVVWLLTRGIQYVLPGRWIDWRIPLISSVCFAAFYAWLTGMQPPALRTVMSLAVMAALCLSGRQWSPWQVWFCCIAAILFIDPLAVLSQSLALSAFAVAALIFWYQWMPLPGGALPRFVKPLIGLLHLQLGMLCLLMPLQIHLFHGVSLSSLVANLFAVPLVTFVTVPLILVGMLLHLSPLLGVEEVVWNLANHSLSLLFGLLKALPDGWQDVDARWQALTLLPWFILIGWRFRSWNGAPAVCITGCVLLTFPLWRTDKPVGWTVHMLDIGQGLAMVVERQGKAVLYDTGLAWPGGDSAKQIIIPWLRWHHLKPDGVIISHEHQDHIGGLNSLRETWPTMWIKSPLRWAGHQPCFRGQRWQWRGLTFTVHWPPEDYREQGNNRSCVVKIDDGEHSVLLTGDIEGKAEQAMLSHHWQFIRSTLIQVPHHGSNTSSTQTLVQRVDGKIALASAARYNAWRFPSVKVAKRYRKEGYSWLNTPQQGQISVTFSSGGWHVRRLRDQILPRWYHQWFGVSADNG